MSNENESCENEKMRLLRILRKMLESEEPTLGKLNLNAEEEKWFEIGFNAAKSRFEGLIDLLEDE